MTGIGLAIFGNEVKTHRRSQVRLEADFFQCGGALCLFNLDLR